MDNHAPNATPVNAAFPPPPYWYRESLTPPKIPATVTAFGQPVSLTHSPVQLSDFGIEKRYTNGSKKEIRSLLDELYTCIIALFRNLSKDHLDAGRDAQEMLLLLQNLHHLINTFYVTVEAKNHFITTQKFIVQRIHSIKTEIEAQKSQA